MNPGGDSFELYRDEARELLADFERYLMLLEDGPSNGEFLAGAFRCLHTIKGSGSMFGLSDIVGFVHALETAFQKIRSGEVILDPRMADIFLVAKDILSTMIEDPESAAVHAPAVREVLGSLRLLIPTEDVTPFGPVSPDSKQKKEEGESPDLERKAVSGPVEPVLYTISFTPGPELFLIGMNPLVLLGELEDLGTLHPVCDVTKIPPLDGINPENCYYSWQLDLVSSGGRDAIRDVFIFIEDTAEILIEQAEQTGNSAPDPDVPPVSGKASAPGAVQPVHPDPEPAASEPLSAATQMPERMLSAIDPKDSPPDDTLSGGWVSVRSEQLGLLVQRIGEFLSLHSRLMMIAGARGDAELTAFGSQFEALIRETRDISLQLHRQPAGVLFSALQCGIRDLCRLYGTQADFISYRGDTELDPETLRRLEPPLLAFFRKHIIVQAETRPENPDRETGPVPVWSVEVRTTGTKAHFELRCENLERGIEETFAGELGKTLETMRGSVAWDAENKPVGSLRIELPLSSAIIEGLLVRIGCEHFVIDFTHILGCIDYRLQESASGRTLVEFRGETLPYVDMREYFEPEAGPEGRRQIVMVSHGSTRVGLLVDGVLDTVSAVIQPLDTISRKSKGVSGAVMMGDGTLALHIDVESIIRSFAEVTR